MRISKSEAESPALLRWLVIIGVAAVSGCSRSDVQVQYVPKEPPPAQAATMPSGRAEAVGAKPRLQWQLPAGWQEVPPGEMRLASFRVQGNDGKAADISIVPLPGQAGTDLDNVNRWRGQVGLDPVTAEDMPKLAESVEIIGQSAPLYDLAGPGSTTGERPRMLAAMMRREGVSWFFKMTGNDALVMQQKPLFIGFLKSLAIATAPPAPESPSTHPPIGDAAAAAQTAPAPAASGNKPSWQVPPRWQEVPGGQFLVAKFIVTGAGQTQAAVNVSMSPGDGGGLVGNVNRWRQQLGLSGLSETEVRKWVTPFDIPGGKAMLADMAGADAKTGLKARLVGIIIPRAGQTWFYKLMGNAEVVAQEREAFTQFVQTAKY